MKRTRHLLLVLLLAALALPMTASADETREVEYLILSQGNEQVAEFALEKAPVLTISNGNLVVACEGDSLEVALGGLSYAFETRQEAINTGISSVTANTGEGNSQPAFSHGTIMGLKSGSKIAVYSVNGLKVSETQAGSDGKARVELGNLPRGIYIIKTPARNFKVVRN